MAWLRKKRGASDSSVLEGREGVEVGVGFSSCDKEVAKAEEKGLVVKPRSVEVVAPSAPVVEDDSSLFGDDVGDTSVSVIQGLGTVDKKNMPMKAILKNPQACVAVKLKGEFALGLGLRKTAMVRRLFMEEHYAHSVGAKGKRAEQMLEALKIEVMKEFEIEKRSAMRGALP